MSPGSSTQSWVGWNSRSSLSSTSGRKPSGGFALASTCQWRRPCACSRNTSYWSMCAPTEPPVAAKLIITSSMRQRGRNAKWASRPRISASHLSMSCTSRVQSCSGRPGKSVSANGPWRTRQASLALSCSMSLASTPSSQASPARSSGCTGDTKPGKALRISRGFFCQYSRRNFAGGMPSGYGPLAASISIMGRLPTLLFQVACAGSASRWWPAPGTRPCCPSVARRAGAATGR